MREFQAPVQGRMTVKEHSYKFIELSNFAEELEAMEKMKNDRYIEGLRPDIRKDVHMHEPRQIKKALKKAFVSEHASMVLNENDQLKSSGNRKGNFKSQAPPKRQKTEARVVCNFCGTGSECGRKLVPVLDVVVKETSTGIARINIK